MTLTAADRLALLGPDGVAAARAEGAAAPPMSPELVQAISLVVRRARPRDDLSATSTPDAA